MRFFLGFCIGNCTPAAVLALIAYALANTGKNFLIPLLCGVVLYVVDSLGRLIVNGFALYSFVALCISYFILYIAYRKCVRISK